MFDSASLKTAAAAARQRLHVAVSKIDEKLNYFCYLINVIGDSASAHSTTYIFSLVRASRLFCPLLFMMSHDAQNGCSWVSRIEPKPPLLHSLGLKLCGTSSSQFVSQDLAIQRQKQNHAQTKSKNPKTSQVSTKTPAVCNPHKNYKIKINPAIRQDYEEKL